MKSNLHKDSRERKAWVGMKQLIDRPSTGLYVPKP